MLVDGSVVMIENMVRHLAKKDDTRAAAQKIRDAAHEVLRPVFFARGTIISSYLPIFTRQAVEGRLFKPMAWIVTFALLGALGFAIIVAPVMANLLFPKGAKEWQNPIMHWLIMHWLIRHYRVAVRAAIDHQYATVGIAAFLFAIAIYLTVGGPIGSEFLPPPPPPNASHWLNSPKPPLTMVPNRSIARQASATSPSSTPPKAAISARLSKRPSARSNTTSICPPATTSYQFLGLIRSGFPRSLWRLRASRCHHDRVHQPTARPPQRHGSVQQGAYCRGSG